MIEFSLPQMSCGHCVRAITQAVHQVDAQATVQVDLPAQRVQIESTHAAAEFAAALADEGYAPA